MLRTHFGDRCTVGAGTAITVERCKAALDAGAQFLLTPGTPLDVFSYCAENDIALLPGVLTPTDVATSLQFGYKTMKLFPAGSMPRHYVKDLQGPFNVCGSHFLITIKSPVSNVGAIESDFTTNGVYPKRFDTFWLSLVAIVVKA